MPFNAYIVAAKRTAAGRRKGMFSEIHPADLGAEVVNALLKDVKLDAKQYDLIDDVIIGCVSNYGAQAGNLGRNVVLASKLPESVPGTTVDRQCGSSQQAIHFAAQAVMSGVQDIVIAGGVEVMSKVPISCTVTDAMEKGRGYPMSENMKQRYPEVPFMFSQFQGAEMVAQQWGCTREEMDQMAVTSHARAAFATDQGYFKREIVPVQGKDGKMRDEDEGIRRGLKIEKVRKLKLLAGEDGRLSAGTASQISDGASGVMIVNERGLIKLGLKPRAKIISLALAGTSPVSMLSGPIPASKRALKQIGMTLDEIDLYEVNEAFASVPCAWYKDLKADYKKLNVNGGAMALGHPLGATGTKLMTTLLHELERRNKKYGLLAICEGGGTANATIIEVTDQVSPVITAKL